MDWQVIVVYILLLATVVLFITDRVRTDIVGLMIISILGLLGILKPKELLEGFSNQALVTIAAMFVLSAALMRSGLVAALGGKLTQLSKGSPLRFLALSLVAVCVHVRLHQQHTGGGGLHPGGVDRLQSSRPEPLQVFDADFLCLDAGWQCHAHRHLIQYPGIVHVR